MSDILTIRRPDDWHVHLRDGAMLEAVAVSTARQFARAIIMPNLVPPVTTSAMASAYRDRILAALPEGSDFTPLMTAYLTDTIDAEDLERRVAEELDRRAAELQRSFEAERRRLQQELQAVQAGQESPEASSRWPWLSVVRAPIAPQQTRSEIYCGLIRSRYSCPAGMPFSARSSNSSRALRTPLLM